MESYIDQLSIAIEIGYEAELHSNNIQPFTKEWIESRLDSIIYHDVFEILESLHLNNKVEITII